METNLVIVLQKFVPVLFGNLDLRERPLACINFFLIYKFKTSDIQYFLTLVSY